MRPRFGELKESRVNKIVWPLAKTRDLNHRARFVLSPALPNPFKEKNFYNQSCTHGSITLVAWKAVNNLHSVSVDNSRLIPLPLQKNNSQLYKPRFGHVALTWSESVWKDACMMSTAHSCSLCVKLLPKSQECVSMCVREREKGKVCGENVRHCTYIPRLSFRWQCGQQYDQVQKGLSSRTETNPSAKNPNGAIKFICPLIITLCRAGFKFSDEWKFS